MMLWKLLSRLDRDRFEPVVIALSAHTDGMLQRFEGSGIECRLLGMKTVLDAFALLRLSRTLSDLKPDIVQGWMYYGNVAATLATVLARAGRPVLWNVRGTLVDAAHTPWTTALTIWAGGKLSSLPARIINNSVASATQHERRYGYDPSRRVILPNGFDTELFQPSAEARASLRAALGVPAGALLVGLIGRYHPMKEHATFLRAAGMLGERHPHVHFVLAGERVNASNDELCRLVEAHGLEGRVHLLGRRDDMHIVAAALDIAASASSSGEGFPNVIGEAMSCGVPCVVTDVGDSASVVGDTGRSVQARDVQALAQALDGLVAMDPRDRARLGLRARQRIVDHFSLQSVVQRYESLYTEVHDRAHAAQA